MDTSLNLPLVSIIVPVYNTASYLRRSLDSILSQTYTHWEAIIVDDGSTDGSGAICDEYAGRDARFRVIHRSNSGVAATRNAGLDAAAGEYLGFVDSDDWIEPDMFRSMVTAILKRRADIATCNVRIVYPNKTTVKKSTDELRVVDRDEAIGMIYEDKQLRSFLWDKLFRRSLFTVRFPEGRIYEDMIVMLKLFAGAERIVMLPGVYYNYRMRTSSIVHAMDLDNRQQLVEALDQSFGQMMGMRVRGWNTKRKKRTYYRRIIRICREVVSQCPNNEARKRFLRFVKKKIESATFAQMIKLKPQYMLWGYVLKYVPSWFGNAVGLTHLPGKGRKKLF